MKLRYRGTDYLHNPTIIDDIEHRGVGHYRGHQIEFAYPRHIPVPQSLDGLTYRGVQYSVNESGQVETAPAAPRVVATPATQDKVTTRVFANARKALPREVAMVHQENIRRRLQQRLDTARNQGNDQLIHQLEVEMQQFA